MVFDVAFIVFPQALPRGGVEDEGKGLERNGDADVQVSVDHIVVEDTGALFPAEGAPEQTGGVNAGPEDERWGDETQQTKEQKKNSQRIRLEFRADCPDEDDDRRGLGHGPDQAAHTHHTEEGEEGLLAPRTGTFSWNHAGILRGDSGEARTACEVRAVASGEAG